MSTGHVKTGISLGSEVCLSLEQALPITWWATSIYIDKLTFIVMDWKQYGVFNWTLSPSKQVSNISGLCCLSLHLC